MALKNNFLILILLFSLSSCYGMCTVEPKYTEEANRLYNLPFTYRANLSNDEIYKIFGGCYSLGDRVFVAQTMYKKKYILLRAGEPYTYADEDTWFGF